MFRTITISAFSMMMALTGCTSAKKVEAPYTGAAEKWLPQVIAKL